MAKKKQVKRSASAQESDETYFLKIVMFLVFGSLWLRIENFPDWQIPIPIGLLLGLWFATHDHFQVDRKIEYAVLLIATMVGFWLPIGLKINI